MLGDRDAADALENFGSRLDDIDLSTLKKLGKMKSALDEADFYTQPVSDVATYLGPVGGALNVIRFATVQVPKHVSDRAYQEEQAHISRQLMGAVASTLQDYSAENYQSAKQQYYTLSYVPMHLLTSEHQSGITQLQQQAAAKMNQYALASQTQDIQRIIDSQAAATQYRDFIKMFSSNTKNYQMQLDVSSIQQTLASTSSSDMVLSEDVSRIKAFLEQSHFALGDGFYQLLEADEEKKTAVLTAVEYLEAENKKAFVSQQREQLFDYLGKGFVILDKVADAVAVPALKKVAALGLNGAIITDAVMKLASGVVGAACFDPIFSVAIAATNLYRVFSKSEAPSQLDLIQSQLIHVSGQVAALHDEMREQFRDVHMHLANVELVIRSSVQSLKVLIKHGVGHRLTLIQHDLKHLAHITQYGFRDLLVTELDALESRVKSYDSGIILLDQVNHTMALNDLSLLSQWLRKKSFSRYVTGLLLFNDDGSGVLRQCVTEKQFCDYMTMIMDERAFDILFPLIFATAKCEGWISTVTQIPNIRLWKRALSSYLLLRSDITTRYDYDEVELGEVFSVYNEILSSIDQVRSPHLLDRIRRSLAIQLQSVQDQYSDLKQVGKARRTHQTNQINYTMPKKATFIIHELIKVGKKNRGSIDLMVDVSTREKILSAIKQKAVARVGINPFEPDFLLAEREGLIQYKIGISRSTTTAHDDDKKRCRYCYKTSSIKYGVDIAIVLVGTDKRFVLTSSTGGYATWRQDESEIQSFDKQMAERTSIHQSNMQSALNFVQAGLTEHYAKKESNNHYVRILDRLMNSDSAFYYTLKQLHALKFCLQVGGHDAVVERENVGLGVYVDRMLSTFLDFKNYMETVTADNALSLDSKKVEDFFKTLKPYQVVIAGITQLCSTPDILTENGSSYIAGIADEFALYREAMNKKQEIETAARAGSSILPGGGLFKRPVTSSGMACLFSLASLVVCSLSWLSPTVEQADTACRTVAPLAADEGELYELPSLLSYFEAGICLLFIMGLGALLGYLASQRQPNFAPR